LLTAEVRKLGSSAKTKDLSLPLLSFRAAELLIFCRLSWVFFFAKITHHEYKK